jgi:hypothetical protein
VCIRICDQGFVIKGLVFLVLCLFGEGASFCTRGSKLTLWRGEQHIRRFGLECASFARVGAAGKATNSYDIWITVDTFRLSLYFLLCIALFAC